MVISSIEKSDLWLLIRKNQPDPIGVAPLSAYQKRITPIVEIKFATKTEMWEISRASTEQILAHLMTFYHDLITTKQYFPGVYGDWMKLCQWSVDNHEYLKIDFIGSTTWIKPVLAADLGIFIQNTTQTYFIGIIRGNNPGRTLPAIVGGILECNRLLDSAAYTILKEAKEECNLQLKYQGDIQQLQQDYNIQEIPVVVENFASLSPNLEQISTKIHFITTIPTPEQERNADGTKRVYIVTAYVILINLGNISININQLQQLFASGDDARALYIVDVSINFRKEISANQWFIPHFGLHHHPDLFKQMILALQKQYPQSFR